MRTESEPASRPENDGLIRLEPGESRYERRAAVDWAQPGTFSTQTARLACAEAQAFLLARGSALRGAPHWDSPFADLHEYYAGAVAAYVSLLEEGSTAHRETIRVLHEALARAQREAAP